VIEGKMCLYSPKFPESHWGPGCLLSCSSHGVSSGDKAAGTWYWPLNSI